jgi:hypothetical protein
LDSVFHSDGSRYFLYKGFWNSLLLAFLAR